MTSLISDILDFDVIDGYISEIEQDTELRRHISDITEKSDLAFMADKKVRLGWYAFTRALNNRNRCRQRLGIYCAGCSIKAQYERRL